ncbi:MAG TPA: HAMP domain-containing sensor histidine kinase [Rhodanobacter sp.]
MKTGSLRLRLLLGAGIAIFMAMVVAWLAMFLLFERHIERRAASELTQDAIKIVANLHLADDGTLSIRESPDDPRFDRPSSGRYWEVSSMHGSIRSRSLWDESLPEIPLKESGAWSSRVTAGPFGQHILLLERTVRPNTPGPAVLVQVALDEEELRLARNEFGRELALFLCTLWATLLVAAGVQVQLGLRPLSRIRDELSTLQHSATARLRATYPREIEPLTQAINKLAEAREKDILRMRRRAADLAHSLKTPLAALSAQSRRARASGATSAADGLDRVIAAAAAVVEAELTRARAAAIRDLGLTALSSPQEVTERVVDVVERTDIGARLVFEVDIDESLRIPVAFDDLTELIGALVENAARFARRRVRIGAEEDGTARILRVEDDGKGLNMDAEKALMRGGRLDEAGAGHDGIGLSIVYELSEATGGRINLGRSPLGGLLASIRWEAPPQA